MKIALLISGRAARYEVGLLHTLLNSNHDIYLFISINGKECKYYDNMKKRLGKWIKNIKINEFILEEEFFNTVQPTEWDFSKQIGQAVSCQMIKGKYVPYNAMSMYFNDMNAFKMASDFSEKNNIQYDCYMKFRSDIIDTQIPENIPIEKDNLKLFTNKNICMFTSHGIHKTDIISDAWAWGNKKTMEVYCNTYNFVLKMNKTYNGKYFIAFEDCITDNIVENKIPYTYTTFPYYLDLNRRIFDLAWDKKNITDARINNIQNALNPIDIYDSDSLDHIPAIRHENYPH